MNMHERLIVALDYPDWQEAEALVKKLPEARHFKVGLELYLASSGSAVSRLKELGKEVFLDLKFHDIPQTVAGAVAQAARSGADMMNVHASGGTAMLEAAVRARDLAQEAGKRTRLIAVTILTSLDNNDIRTVGYSDNSATDAAVRLAGLAEKTGLDGVVCSPHEISRMRQAYGSDFVLVTPGVRPSWSEKGDQKRVFTPSDAIRDGADYIVVGRPITKAEVPAEAYASIISEMEDGINA